MPGGQYDCENSKRAAPNGVYRDRRNGSRLHAPCLQGRGVYAEAQLWDSLDEYAGRPLLRARAALRKMRRGWVLSHDSAAHALGISVGDGGVARL